MEKSPDAFRTISEVAEWLDVPTHVLRFWESRFSQIKPVKRAGGRRYYRPSDMKLIGGVKALLHDEGMTIRGVQKLLREKGIKHVAGFSKPLDTEAEADDGVTLEHRPVEAEPVASPASEPQPVMPMMPSAAATATTRATPIARSEPSPADVAEADGQADMFSEHDDADAAPDARPEDREGERRIPETPDVPKVDPADDDPTFLDRPGLAARIALAPKSRLIADRDVVRRAVEKLSVISQRAR